MEKIEPVKIVIEPLSGAETLPTTTGARSKVTLLSHSPGVGGADLMEMLARARGIDVGPGVKWNRLNLVFHSLPGGSFALGRLVSLHRGDSPSFLVQYSVIPASLLLRWNNHPIRLYQTLLNSGMLSVFLSKNSTLDSLDIASIIPKPSDLQAELIETDLLLGLSLNPGRDALATLTSAVLDSIETVFTSTVSSVPIASGIIHLLPISWRTELTFSLGLVHRDYSDFRLCSIAPENHSLIKSFKNGTIPFFDLEEITQSHRDYLLPEGWGLFIREILRREAFRFYADKLREQQENFDRRSNDPDWSISVEEIDFNGFDYLGDLYRHYAPVADNAGRDKNVTGIKKSPKESLYHPHKKSPPEEPLAIIDEKNHLFSPYQQLYAVYPQYQEELLQLDSLIAHVLQLESAAVEELQHLWKNLCRNFPSDAIWAIREEYVRYIQATLTTDPLESLNHKMQRNIYVLEALDVLIN